MTPLPHWLPLHLLKYFCLETTLQRALFWKLIWTKFWLPLLWAIFQACFIFCDQTGKTAIMSPRAKNTLAYSPWGQRWCQTTGQAVLLTVPKDLDFISSAWQCQESPLPLYCLLRIWSWGTGRDAATAATSSGMNNKAFVLDPGFMSAFVKRHQRFSLASEKTKCQTLP